MSFSIPLYPIRSSIDTVVSETGGGKGVLGVIQHLAYMYKGRRVGTNYELYLEHFPEAVKDIPVTRIPDLPTRYHLEQLGFGSHPNNRNKDEYGGLFWDEVSLFLDSKRTPDFKPTYAWLKQRRKKHWNVLFTAQHEDQLQDELYKSLVNRLIVVGATDLDTIPFFSPILRLFGRSGYQPEGHYFYVFKSKTRMSDITHAGEYQNKPFRKMYNTDQVFDVDTEWLKVNGEWQDVDMRANFTYLPKRYLVDKDFLGIRYRKNKRDIEEQKQGAITFRANQLKDSLPHKRKNKMAGIPNRYAQKKRKFIMIFLIIFLIVMLFIVIKNFTKPKEAPKQKATKPPVELSQAPVREQTQVKEISNDDLNDEPVFSDFVSELFAQFDSRLVSKVTANNRFFGYVNFYDNQTGTLHQSISFEDFEMLGYLVEDSASGVWVSKGDHVFVVTSKPDPEQLNFNQTISNQNQPF